MLISDWSSDVCSSDLGNIAVVDVHMSQAPLETGRHQLAIFGAVAHIKGDLGAIASSALTQRSRNVVRTRGHFGPGDDPVAVDQGWRIVRHGRLDSVEKIGRASCRESVCQYV